jgi:hypothetical protein
MVPRHFPIVDNLLKITGANGTPLFDSTQLVAQIRRARRASSLFHILQEVF